MTSHFSAGWRLAAACLVAGAGQLGAVGVAWAQQPPPAAAPPPGAAAPTSNAMTTPAMAGPLVANPDPLHLDVTPFFGPMYVSGAVSGLGLTQTDPVRNGFERSTTFDISNAQAALQTTEGLFQFFLEPGIYALPTIGVPYRKLTDMPTSTNLYGGLPVAWGKIAPTDTFSIQ